MEQQEQHLICGCGKYRKLQAGSEMCIFIFKAFFVAFAEFLYPVLTTCHLEPLENSVAKWARNLVHDERGVRRRRRERGKGHLAPASDMPCKWKACNNGKCRADQL
ncbi:hypothetical protein GOODEAATRI_017468 [Goodea atripinnis]|uniref:Uncharacterized protein n=1 Tax=Goodea atripinnis TaxID=208336 RepID=A0ABV0PPG2_9TELE